MIRFSFRLWVCALVLIVSASTWADPQVGKTWAPFQLVDGDGAGKSWSPGRVTVVAFCAYWCDTWKVQVPRLVSARNSLAGLPVDFTTVSVDGRWSEVAKNNRGLPLWLDRGGEWSRSMGVDRVPTVVVLDADGVARFVSGSVVRTEDILDAVHSALEPKQDGGTLYLTFDDFPQKGANELLDTLRALKVKATFFCIGSRVEAEAKLFKRAIAEGHSLQMHSWDHDAANPQLDRCRDVFKAVLQLEPTLYRPPGSENIGGEQVHHRIVDPYDFARPSRKELLRRILPGVCDAAVIQLHAGVQVTLDVLPELIAELKSRSFRFEILGELKGRSVPKSSS